MLAHAAVGARRRSVDSALQINRIGTGKKTRGTRRYPSPREILESARQNSSTERQRIREATAAAAKQEQERASKERRLKELESCRSLLTEEEDIVKRARIISEL